MADGLKPRISTNRQNGRCFAGSGTAATAEDKLTGKYGNAEILQQAANGTNGLVCGIKYTFNSTGVSDKLTKKTITLKVNEDSGKLTLENVAGGQTDVPNKHLPSAFKK